MKIRFFFKKVFNFLFFALALIWILFEEIFWNNIARFTGWLAQFRIVSRLETVIKRQNRVVALTLFLVPVGILFPFKFYAAYLIAAGLVSRGLMVIVIAKMTSTFFLTRLFILNKEKLMTFKSFAVVYSWILKCRQWVHDRLNTIAVWVKTKEIIKDFKDKIKTLILLRKGSGLSFWYLVLLRRYVDKIKRKSKAEEML
jgi:hypothetical protein